MKQITLCLLLLAAISCADSEKRGTDKKEASSQAKETPCKYGQPVAVFSDSIASILSHRFELNGQKAVEEVKFENGVYLELYQSGCNEIIQEFRFLLDEPYQEHTKSYWFKKAAAQFAYLSSMDEKYIVSYNMWSQILARMSDFTELGEKFEVEENTFFGVNSMKEDDQSMVIVIFERNI